MVKNREYVWYGANHTATVDVTKLKPQCDPAFLDAEAERQLTGGYTSRNKLCVHCHTKKSNTGDCYC